ncbi:helix-turn-helix transcriptional regulator [Staphylococcus saprophyticus]|uniref:helix-turn-helix domain-containing protein n=1 Tax=Staphylococcus saprophyticus TaxID=29385 RepID=UPI0030C3DF6A
MEKLNNIIATNLRVAMAKENISTTKLHLLSGVSRSSITEYRKGNIKQVNLESLSKIAGALNIKPSDLFIEGDSY